MRNYNGSSTSERQMIKILKTKPSVMIKSPELAEDLLCQISSMSTYVRLQIYWWVPRRIIRATECTRRKYKNLTLLTEIFQIILSHMAGNWLFHTLNNSVFSGQKAAEEIRNEICAFLIRKKNLYENFWEGDFDTHIRNMK